MSSREEIILTATQVAKLFRVSIRTVRTYAERGLLERTPDGRYPVSGFKKYWEHLRKQADETEETRALTEARRTLLAAKVEEARLRLDRLKTEYVDRQSVAEGWRQVRAIVDRNILASVDRISATIPAMTAHDRAAVEELTRDLLQNLDQEALSLGIIGAEK